MKPTPRQALDTLAQIAAAFDRYTFGGADIAKASLNVLNELVAASDQPKEEPKAE